ncbi:M949_RS01915 family surface polysaccharide biosynthesis protein [Paludibacterium paludis]|uniref:Uncharacterized protein n=1 Tax=Paludibacterium paludis TaxID=1225769 RepID=A0A918U6F6_9NEIS|nr:hypothetical protein [Paludibacterium paludis]GGY02692.1 hypothetical protein GCM10011289_01040 [Paludibacterium paludis]
MKKLVFSILLTLLSPAHASEPGISGTCGDTLPENLIPPPDRPPAGLKRYKHYCYTDASGSHDLLLSETQDRPGGDAPLSGTIEARLFRRVPNDAPRLLWTIRDRPDPQEDGVRFWAALTELTDLDHDGMVDPILVYRFQDKNRSDDPAFSGRLKIILFHQGRKVVIRARSGTLDDERETSATASYFDLPLVIRRHLVAKMAKMYRDDLFGFDNTHRFQPLKPSQR